MQPTNDPKTGQVPSANPLPLDYGQREKVPRRLGRVILWLIAGVIFFLAVAWILRPRLITTRELPNRVKSSANLKQIGLAILMYTNDFKGRYPDTFGDLILTEDLTPDVFIDPASNDTAAMGPTTQAMLATLNAPGHCSYIYLGKGFDTHTNIPQDAVIAYEPLANNAGAGMSVLFADGHVDWIDAKSAQVISSQVNNATSPVRYPLPASTPMN